MKKYLPIGSVVLLRGGEKRLMIFGIMQTNLATQDEEYDYIGVPYPEGNLGAEHQYLFNHDDITEISFKGFNDEERLDFMEQLRENY